MQVREISQLRFILRRLSRPGADDRVPLTQFCTVWGASTHRRQNRPTELYPSADTEYSYTLPGGNPVGRPAASATLVTGRHSSDVATRSVLRGEDAASIVSEPPETPTRISTARSLPPIPDLYSLCPLLRAPTVSETERVLLTPFRIAARTRLALPVPWDPQHPGRIVPFCPQDRRRSACGWA